MTRIAVDSLFGRLFALFNDYPRACAPFLSSARGGFVEEGSSVAHARLDWMLRSIFLILGLVPLGLQPARPAPDPRPRHGQSVLKVLPRSKPGRGTRDPELGVE